MTAALQLPSLLDEKQDWTVDDLASLPKDLRYELIDGRLLLPSPTVFHRDVCHELVSALRPHCPSGYRAVIDVSLEVDPLNEPRTDVVVAQMAGGLRSPAPISGALLLAEVISPTSHFRDMHAKAKVFAGAGVESYWVVDPTFRGGVVLTEFRLGEDKQYEIVTSTNKVFSTDVPFPATVDVPALTKLLNEYRLAEREGPSIG
ncbi:MAG TPA: Uma2 family endonuclease [Actinoplanes sp.]|jgi:Uma2 family endonuclease|nr:Uma2 family endonuclease [Actinoplanes sp.]